MKAQIEEARRKATEALSKAKEIRDRNRDAGVNTAEWPADDREAYGNAMQGFKEHHGAAMRLAQEERESEEFAGYEAEYLEPDPDNRLAGGGRRGGGDPEGFRPPTEEELAKKKKAHREAFVKYVVGGEALLTPQETHRYVRRDPYAERLSGLSPEERFALLESQDNLGGFLVPDDFVNELIKETAGFAVMRTVARQRMTTRSAASFMTVDGGTDPYPSGVSGSWRAEGFVTGGTAIATQNQPTFGRERVPVHLWLPDVIELTQELLEDAAVDLEAEIRGILAETKALDEDSGFINGSGVGQPEGLLQAGITTINSGASNGQSYAGIVNLFTGLPAQYRAQAKWIMNSLTWGLIMQLEDTAGNPIFPTNQEVPSLFGKEILFSEFMPDGNSDGNDAIVFGDYRFYGIADRRDLRIQRLMERYAPNVGILASARTGGQVLKTAPFRAQNVGA